MFARRQRNGPLRVELATPDRADCKSATAPACGPCASPAASGSTKNSYRAGLPGGAAGACATRANIHAIVAGQFLDRRAFAAVPHGNVAAPLARRPAADRRCRPPCRR